MTHGISKHLITIVALFLTFGVIVKHVRKLTAFYYAATVVFITLINLLTYIYSQYTLITAFQSNTYHMKSVTQTISNQSIKASVTLSDSATYSNILLSTIATANRRLS